MQHVFIAFLLALAGLTTGYSQDKAVAPEAAKILKAYAVSAGLDKLAKAKTLHAAGTITYGNKTKDTERVRLFLKAPGKLRMEAAIDGTFVAMIVNGPIAGLAMGSKRKPNKLVNMTMQEKDEMKQLAMFADLTHMARLGTYFSTLKMGTPETVNGRECHVIIGEDEKLGTATFMICKKTHELVRFAHFFLNKNLPLVVDLDQWKSSKGVKLPTVAKITLGKGRSAVSCTVKFEKWRVGIPLKDELFATDKPVVASPKVNATAE